MTRVRLVLRGMVQGVCYRMCARQEAVRLGVTGWVRNCPDGSVEVVAEGEDAALAAFVRWCGKGPSYARVTDVDERYGDATGEFDSFQIAH